MRHAIGRRVVGGVYAAYFVTSLVGGWLTPGVTGPGTLDPGSIHGFVYQVGVALGLVSVGLYLAVVGLLYETFVPVTRTAGTLLLLFGSMGCVLMAVGSASQLAARGAAPDMAAELLAFNLSAVHVALVFFGTFQLFLGYAIYRSAFVPRLIGIVIAVAGAGWLCFLVPDVPAPLSVPIAVLGGLSELSLMLWLLIAGVDQGRRRGSWSPAASPVET